jgi:phosphohistidine swiveling domain-containing protein
MQKELSLIFTRDFSMFTCDFWHILMTDVIARAYSVSFSGQVIVFNGRAIECYRPSNEMREIKEWIIHLSENHDLFSEKNRDVFEHAVRDAREIIESMKVASREEYFDLVSDLLDAWKRFYPHYMLANFLPGPWRDEFLFMGSAWREPVIERFTHDRHACEGVFEAADIAIRETLRTCLKDISLPVKYAEFLSWQEAMALLQEGRSPLPVQLEERMRGYCMVGDAMHVGISFNALLQKFGYFYSAPEIEKGQKEFKGAVGFFHAPVRGKVFRVFTYDQVSHFPDGSILVAPMTAPEYLPAMKRACAIVTDEGGITCHAAIVSRELQIPCVIGVKIATRVLQDGDEVEVDAEKGIVRLLS